MRNIYVIISTIIIFLDNNRYNRLMKTVLHALDTLEANVIKGLLESEGITCNILGEYLQGAIGGLPATGLIRVVVNEEDYDIASTIIENWRVAKFIA